MNERMARVKVVRGSMEKIRAVKSEVKLFRPLVALRNRNEFLDACFACFQMKFSFY